MRSAENSSEVSFMITSEIEVIPTDNNEHLIDSPLRFGDGMATAEEYSVILLDETPLQESPSLLFAQLQNIVNICLHYTSINRCCEYVQNTKEKVLVVMTNSKYTKALLTECTERKNLKGVYILDEICSSVNDARISYFFSSTNLLQQLELDIEPLNRQLIAFEFFNSNQKTIRDLTLEGVSFMWSQMLIDALKQFPSNAQTMDDMLALCHDYYHDNLQQLKLIEEFRRTYQARMAVKWYTRDSFLFRLLNKAIRTEDIDALYIFRVLIIDLCSQLEEEQHSQLISNSTLTVYHGQRMYLNELSKLKANIGHLVSTNAFFSTSLNERIAVIYSEHDAQSDQRESVLIKINVNAPSRHTIYARINNERLSYVPDEDEVLFSLSTVFKVVDVFKENDKHYWIVLLQTTDEGWELFNEYKQVAKLDALSPNLEIEFGRLLMNMGQYSKAIRYFTSLTTRLHSDNILDYENILALHSYCLYTLGKYDEAEKILKTGLEHLDLMHGSPINIYYLRCRFHLGVVYIFKDNLELARQILEEVLCEQNRILPPSHTYIADTIRGIGWVHSKETGYHQSLVYNERALRIYKQTLPPNHPSRAHVLYSIAGAYEALNKWDLALDYFQQALKAQERYFPNNHPRIAETLRGIAGIYGTKSNWDKALIFYFRAISIWKENFPQGHVYMSNCLDMIGSAYRCQKQLNKALHWHTEAIDMRKKLFPSSTHHPQLGLALTYLDMDDNDKAIELLLLTCEYWKKQTKNPSNTLLNAAQSCLGTGYSHQGQLQLANETFEQVLLAQKNAHLDGHTSIALTLHHMGSNYRRMNLPVRAKQYYEESLAMFLQFFESNHHEVVRVKEKICRLDEETKQKEIDIEINTLY